MTWILRRIAFICAGEAVDMLTPSKRISPAVGSSSRRTARPTVVLPQPDSPTSPSVSPGMDLERDVVDGAHRRRLVPRKPRAHGEILRQVA